MRSLLALPLFLLPFTTLLPLKAHAEWVVYEISGTINQSTNPPNPLVGLPYELKILYTTEVTGNSGYYHDSLLGTHLTFDDRMFVTQASLSNDLRVEQGRRFEQNFSCHERVLTNPGTGESEEVDSSIYGCEVVIEDEDGVFPTSSTPPTSLNLADFEYRFVSIFFSGGTRLTCSIDTATFSTVNQMDLLRVEGPFFESLVDETFSPYKYATYYRVTSTFTGFPLIYYLSRDFVSWNTSSSNQHFILGQALRINSIKNSYRNPAPWPRFPSEYVIFRHPLLPGP